MSVLVTFYPKAAYTLQELHLLLEGESLDGIKVVDEQRANVQKVRIKAGCRVQKIDMRHMGEKLET